MLLGARMLLEVIFNTMNKKNVIMEKEESKREEPSGDRLEWQNGNKQKYWYIEACSYDQFPPQRQTVIHVSGFIEVFYGITAPRLTMRCVVWMAVCQCFQPASYMLNFSWVAWSSPFLILKLTKELILPLTGYLFAYH